jgi:hypothetical protein
VGYVFAAHPGPCWGHTTLLIIRVEAVGMSVLFPPPPPLAKTLLLSLIYA